MDVGTLRLEGPSERGGAASVRTGRSRRAQLCISDFLTDGSLARLASALSELTGADVTLRTRLGAVIDRRVGESPPWVIRPEDGSSKQIADAVDAAVPNVSSNLGELGVLTPLHAGGRTIGGLLLTPGAAAERPGLMAVVEGVAATVSERCGEVAQLRRRNEELAVLFALTGELVTARELPETLERALAGALAALNMDAGSLHVVGDDGVEEARGAAIGLSESFLVALDRLQPDPTASEIGGLIDASEAAPGSVHIAPDGSVLAIDSLPEPADRMAGGVDANPLITAARAEGLAGMLSGELLYGRRRLGTLRLFTRGVERFGDEDLALARNICEQIAAALEAARLGHVAQRNRQIRRQIRLAREVQSRLLPEDSARFDRLDVAARYEPSAELSGDFFDLIPLGGALGLVIGDVVGKGLPAALLMASVRASFRAYARRLRTKDDPDEVVRRVNVVLDSDTQPNEFATAFFAKLDLETLTVHYCNAGHDPPLLVRCGDDGRPVPGGVGPLEEGGPLMGVNAGFEYVSGRVSLGPRDVLVAYTDGVTDAMNFEQEKFGRARLTQSVLDQLRSKPNSGAKDIADRVLWDVRRFVGLNTDRDDVTLLIARALDADPR